MLRFLSRILAQSDSSSFPAQQALGKDAQGVREQDARLQRIYRCALCLALAIKNPHGAGFCLGAEAI